MSKALFTCPTCKGRKTTNLTLNGEPFTMPCHGCDGAGEVSLQKKAELDGWQAIWCRCEGPKNTEFFDDGAHPELSKNHWRCKDCEKVTELG